MFPSPTCRKNIQWHIKVVLGVLYRWGKTETAATCVPGWQIGNGL